MNFQDVVIVSAVRTPIGSFCGNLSSLKGSDLGSIVIKECLTRINLNPSDVSEVILGQTLTAGQGQNPARQAAIKAEFPVHVPAYQVNMLCGSGLKAIANGYLSLKSGESNIIVAGGQESMSQAQHTIYLRNGVKMGDCNFVDTLLCDGLVDAFTSIHMGVTAENVAKDFGITREEQDLYAILSQQKAAAAISAGHFDKEIVPVTILNKKESILISKDEYPKPSTTIQDLSKLKPVFIKVNGTVTAGNASGINDGAAAVVLMTKEEAIKRDIIPLAQIVGIAESGVEPNVMGIGPIPAIELLLQKIKWSKDEVDLYELNEAFAAQSLACIRKLDLDPNKVNINGGAIALGHPIGASGARILVTLLHSLERIGGKKGIAALCVGGGMGIALAIERK
ncbi:acetyl-CoA acetyltransferase, cytosolic-like [Vespa mandarinia]|uniref:acetyl-CoA acetyltransferase, cytosolic-like n=1 Tax=Vespa mandarinia TaxID=7446 RepID=UPI00160AC5D3|nr:acetyl-CoA acetyltransferase, cytosolic-like [Vespa mandarinia]